MMLSVTLPTALYATYANRFGPGTLTLIFAVYVAGILAVLVLLGDLPTVSGTGLSFLPPCFHVHGGGPIVGLLVNEFGIACTVTTAIRESPDLPLPAEIRRTGDRAEARRDKERGQQLNAEPADLHMAGPASSGGPKLH